MMRRRKLMDTLLRWVMLGSLLLVSGVFLAILGVILAKGLPALSWNLVSQVPNGGYYLGREGGIANAIIGTLCLALGASLIAIPLSLPAALGLQKEYASPGFARLARLVLDVLWGTPSIVFGAIGFVVMMRFGIRASLLGGILALSMVMLPIMIRGMDEVIRTIPEELKEVPTALGATRFEMVKAVVLRQAFPGILTSILMALGRGMGDAASVLFTAGFTDNLPGSLADPVASLPLAIFFQVGSPIPEVQQRAYASAIVLLILILAINLASRLLERRFTRNTLR